MRQNHFLFLKIRSSGLSLIEMMIVVIIISIVATYSVSSYSTIVARNLLKSDLNRLAALADFARVEAQRTSCDAELQVTKPASEVLNVNVILVVNSNPGCILDRGSSNPNARDSKTVRSETLQNSLFDTVGSMNITFATPNGVIRNFGNGNESLVLRSKKMPDVKLSVKFYINGTAFVEG